MVEKYKTKKTKMLYDWKSNDIKLQIGDLVSIDRPAGHKLSSKFSGPYRVVNLDEKK